MQRPPIFSGLIGRIWANREKGLFSAASPRGGQSGAAGNERRAYQPSITNWSPLFRWPTNGFKTLLTTSVTLQRVLKSLLNVNLHVFYTLQYSPEISQKGTVPPACGRPGPRAMGHTR